MPQSHAQSLAVLKIFEDYCLKKKYQVEVKEIQHAFRAVVSNLKSRTNINVFHTGSIHIDGPQSELKDEMLRIKKQFEESPDSFIKVSPPIKACAAKYDVLSNDLRDSLKEALIKISSSNFYEAKPDKNSDYRLKIVQGKMTLAVTQFNNGTLWLQGKKDELFDCCCSEIEKTASPSTKEVIARFLSDEEESLNHFMKVYTPHLLSAAEATLETKLGHVDKFITDYDKKWLIASEALCQSQIPMPEYTAYVMPASKAFEGFCKKLLTGIGLFDPEHFKVKTANFSRLSDKINSQRKAICDKEKYAEVFLERIRLQIDLCRNLMMHSDDSLATKLSSAAEARQKLDQIVSEMREIYNYFSGFYKLV